jgi:translation initiation factor 4G
MIDLVFEKALVESKFSTMYAELVFEINPRIAGVKTKSIAADGQETVREVTFKSLILNKCQHEFENKPRIEKIPDEVTDPEAREMLELKNTKLRMKNMGLMIFIGELYKKGLLKENIMHYCVQQLLKNPEDEEDLEYFTQFFTNIGAYLDNGRGNNPQIIAAYIAQIKAIIDAAIISPRIRFLLKDVLDLHESKWEKKRAAEGPKTIKEVHADIARADREKEQQLIRDEMKRKEDRRTKREMAPTPTRGTPKAPAAQGKWNVVGGGAQRGGRGGRGAPASPHGRGGNQSAAPAASSRDGKVKNVFDLLGGGDDDEEDREEEPEEDVEEDEEEEEVAEEAPIAKKEYTEDEVETKLRKILKTFWDSTDPADTVRAIKELGAVDHHVFIITNLFEASLNTNDEEKRELAIKLFNHLAKSKQYFSAETIQEGFVLQLLLAAESI